MNVKGLKISDIMDLSWEKLNSLNLEEMRQLTGRLVSASNKRIRRLTTAKRGTSSFAYQYIEERGKPFSTRGKDLNQLRTEFRTAKQFLSMKTSTIKGWNKYRKEMEERTGYITDNESKEWSDSTWKKYWKVYRRFTETHGGVYRKGDSDRIQQELMEIMNSNDKRKSADSFQKLIEEKYDEMYEEDTFRESEIADYFDTED